MPVTKKFYISKMKKHYKNVLKHNLYFILFPYIIL